MEKDQIDYSRRDVLKKGTITAGALVLGGTATGTAAAGIGDGRVGHYNLNNLHYNVDKGEKTQNHVHDASPEKNHGKWKGNEDDPIVDGKVGNAVKFHGNDDYIVVSDKGSIPSGSNDDELTVSAWINVDPDANLDQRHEIVGIFKEWTLEWNRFDNKTIDLATWGSNTGEGKTSLQEGTWHHVVATWSAGSDGTISIYVNGDLDKTVDSYIDTSAATGNDLTIGTYLKNDSPVDPFDGRLDEVRVYDRVLSGSEIQELADMGDD